MSIISIILSLIMMYVTYKLLEEHGFIAAWIAKMIYVIIAALIVNGFNFLIPIILISLVLTLIETAIDYFFFVNSNSFWLWFLYEIIFGILLAILLVLLGFVVNYSNILNFFR